MFGKFHAMALVDKSKLDTSVRKNINTSSLNNYFLCHHCNKKVSSKNVIEDHLKTCLKYRTCKWCNVTFKNRGNLVRHAFCVHGDKSAIKPHSSQNICEVCTLTFPDPLRLKYHIRSIHFNLKSKIMSYEDKVIDQVWYEKVYNSSKIVEIKKASHNLFLIRKLEDNIDVTVQERKIVVDLSEIYPTGRAPKLGKCIICKKTMLKRDLKKHYDERHLQIEKHHCNNCNKSFKRSVAYVRHVCNKIRTRRRKIVL